MLPSDFSGAPAGAVSGSVVDPSGDARTATRPRLALEWLVGFDSGAPKLVQERVDFQRSQLLQHDFDIDLHRPAPSVTFGDTAIGGVHMAVAKIVYFDDRVPDDTLDRACSGPLCDEVKAVSAHFVVYLDQPLGCPRVSSDLRVSRSRLAAGYHYYSFENGVIREIGPEEALRLDAVAAKSDLKSDFTMDLESFTTALLRTLGRTSLDGC